MLQKTKGIVLRTIKYKDTSMIADVYTELAGRVSFLVPVQRSKKSLVKSVLFQPLALLEIEADFRPNASIYKVKEVKLLEPFGSLPYDPYKSAIAMFISEFLCRALREEAANAPLFAYLYHSVLWLDICKQGVANFHLVFLMRLSRFLGLYPNLDDYTAGCCFDMLNAVFVSSPPLVHTQYLVPQEASRLVVLMRMNYRTMHLYRLNREQRIRCLTLLNDYYRLHLPDFPELKSLHVLKELFD